MEEELVTVKQAAEITGLSTQAIYKALAEERLPKVEIGKMTLIRRSDLAAWGYRGKPKREGSDESG